MSGKRTAGDVLVMSPRDYQFCHVADIRLHTWLARQRLG